MHIADLAQHGVPDFGIEAMLARGIADLLPVQERAVQRGVLRGTNLVVMAPTSSGKTLIGELAALQHAVARKGAIFLTSHKALAYEKYVILRESYEPSENRLVRVTLATGDQVTDEDATEGVAITVATFEKWYYMLVDNPARLRSKSLLIVDEFQTVGDSYRGPVVEALLTWTLAKAPNTQIIALSATIPNIDELARWLGAEIVSVQHRSVPLVEEVWSARGTITRDRDREAQPSAVRAQARPTDTLSAIDRVSRDAGLPVVVFCVTKNDAHDLAVESAKRRDRRPACEELVNDLDEAIESNPITRSLRDLLPKGIGFHTADLDLAERRLIELAFRDGRLDLLFATPTLSAGVNLPIKTVIFDKCERRWANEYLAATEYLNMAGRAGRRGMQESGRSILLARDAAEFHRYKNYLASDPERVVSRLLGVDLTRTVLQAVAGGIARSRAEIDDFFSKSFHAAMSGESGTIDASEVDACLSALIGLGMVVTENATGALTPTPLGVRVATSGVLPQTGQYLFRALQQASRRFGWTHREAFEKPILLAITGSPDLKPSVLPDGLLHVHKQDDTGTFLAVAADYTKLVSSVDIEDFRRALLTAWVLARYLNAHSFGDIARGARYATAGNVRRAAGYAGWMLQAAASLEEARGEQANPEFRRWLSHLSRRLEFGVTDSAVELCAIARLGDVRGVGRNRAERLAERGFGDLTKLLEAEIGDLADVLNSRRRAELMREAVVRYLDDRSKHNQIAHANRASACGRDPLLVNDFYEARGMAFNRAALRLLQTVTAKAREQDTGRDSEPDLAIPLDDGIIVIECKAKQSDQGTIGLHEAFEVIAKSAHLTPVGRVTLGKPQFDQAAIERAPKEQLTLITHITLCEAVVRVWEGQMTTDDLLRVLRRGEYVDRADLPRSAGEAPKAGKKPRHRASA
jgi:helicase